MKNSMNNSMKSSMKRSVFKRTLVGTTAALVAVFSASALINAAPSGLRSIFLNGMDISGARNQQLKNVDIQISESGDIFIIAPHYQVSEEDAFTPLSKFVQGINAPAHKQPQKVGSEQTAGTAGGGTGTSGLSGQPGQQGQAGTVQPTAPAHNEPKALDNNPTPEIAAAQGSDESLQKPEDPPPALPDDSQK